MSTLKHQTLTLNLSKNKKKKTKRKSEDKDAAAAADDDKISKADRMNIERERKKISVGLDKIVVSLRNRKNQIVKCTANRVWGKRRVHVRENVS